MSCTTDSNSFYQIMPIQPIASYFFRILCNFPVCVYTVSSESAWLPLPPPPPPPPLPSLPSHPSRPSVSSFFSSRFNELQGCDWAPLKVTSASRYFIQDYYIKCPNHCAGPFDIYIIHSHDIFIFWPFQLVCTFTIIIFFAVVSFLLIKAKT